MIVFATVVILVCVWFLGGALMQPLIRGWRDGTLHYVILAYLAIGFLFWLTNGAILFALLILHFVLHMSGKLSS